MDLVASKESTADSATALCTGFSQANARTSAWMLHREYAA
jgi:hypothetical protein